MNSSQSSILYNLDVERAILSALLFDGSLMEELSLKVKSSDFYLPAHAHMFKAMTELSENNKPIDETFVKNILLKSNDYDELALLDVMAANPISNAEAYIETFLEYSKKRKLAMLGTMLKKKVLEDGEESSEVLSYTSNMIDKIDESSVEGELSIGEMAENFLEFMEEAKFNNGVVGIRTGISELDKLDVIGKPGDLMVIGARPSVGKTALATSMLANMIDNGEHILFTSIDMPYDMLMLRLVSALSKETIWDLKRGMPKDKKAVNYALERIKEHVTIHNEKNVAWSKIKTKSKRAFRQNPKISVWFVDHIGKIAYKEPMYRRFEIGEVTAGAKAIGEEMGVLPILLTQLNRDSVNRAGNKPNLGDLKESGAIEEDATHVILPHREAYHQKGQNEREADVTDAELIVAKNQSGPTGIARCKFNAKYTQFTNDAYEVIYDGGSEMDVKEPTKIEMPRVLG